MPAKSESQQQFMGMVHAEQEGKLKNASPAIKKAAKSMKKKDVIDFASTKHKGLPKKVKKTKKKTYVSESLDSFLRENVNENINSPESEDIWDLLSQKLQENGLSFEEADFALSQIDQTDLDDLLMIASEENEDLNWVAKKIKEAIF